MPRTVSLKVGRPAATTGYPDATNTGPTPGTTFTVVPDQATSGTGWSWSGSSLRIEADNATVSSLYVKGTVIVDRPGVTIQDCKVEVTSSDDSASGIAIANGGTGYKVLRCEIFSAVKRGIVNGKVRLATGIYVIQRDEAGILRGNNIYHCNSGVIAEAGLIEDNYVHDPGFQPMAATPNDLTTTPDHLNGMCSNGGATTALTYRHNTIFMDWSQTDCIALFQDFGNITNRTLDDNLLGGAAFCIYGGGNAQLSSNVVIRNNKFSTKYTQDPAYTAPGQPFNGHTGEGGFYGPVTAFQAGGTGNSWTGNVWYDGPNQGQAVPSA